MKKELPLPWSVPVGVEDIPDTGLHMYFEAPDDVRSKIADVAGVREILGLSAAFDLSRRGAGVHVVGLIKARVGQTCVVSLEPIENSIEEGVDLLFAPAVSAKEPSEDDEPPEVLVDGKVDLGALATEFLMLGIDPYPRKTGVEFVPPKREESGEHPFAALKGLKKRFDGQQS